MSNPNIRISLDEDDENVLTFPDDYFYFSQNCVPYQNIIVNLPTVNFEQSTR